MTLVSVQTKQYLRDIVIPLRLSCVSASGWPVVLSLLYLYRDGLFYCATQENARVVGYLRREPRCAFEIASDQPPYCGVRGQGMVTLDSQMGPEILQHLLIRYLGSTESPLAQRLLAQSQYEVAIIIQPSKVFTWNYTSRMKDTVSMVDSKPCPD
jgi:hypothetical protein